ncbi:MAG: TonB-dependent receptor [Desulfuromonadales bacterium]|nr:TonB-dependent receptor [Desulfuromonadales bacterium]
MTRRIAVLLALITAAPTMVHGEEQKGKQETNLDEIVVTATRTEKSIADAPGSVSVVTATEMKRRNIQSLDEALNMLPGVFDNRLKGLMGTTSSVTFRGLSGSGRSLLLLDGMPLNDAYSASQPWGGLNAQNMSRIEVVRGPSSSLYGGNAMGGVINFMSRMPDKREFTLSGGYGGGWDSNQAMANLWSTYASYGDKIGKFRLFASYGYRTTDGYPTGLVTAGSAPTAASGIIGATPTMSNTGAAKYLVGDTGNNGWWDYSAAIRAQYDFSDTSNIRFSWLRTANKYKYDNPHTYLINAAGTTVYTYRNAANTSNVITESSFLSGDGSTVQDTYTIHAEAQLGTVKGKFLFGINDQGENWYNTPATATLAGGTGTKSDSPSRTYYTDLQLSAPIMEKHVLTGGFTFRYDTADSNNLPLSDYKNPDSVSGATTQWGGGATQTYSAYLQAEIALLDSLTLYTGVRDDYWVSNEGYAGFTGTGAKSQSYPEKAKNSVNPKGALVWKPLDGTTLRISGGKAFRAPPLNQLYKTWLSSSTLTQYISNPELNPETVLSWDIGLEQNLWKGAKIKATFFENYLSDMIYLVSLPGTTTIGGKAYSSKLYTNVGGGETRGVELEAEQNFGNNLRLFAGYTYTDSAVTEYAPNPALVGKQLQQAPRHMINMGLDASYGPASLSLTGRYVSKRYGQDDNSDRVSGVYGSYDPYFVMDMKTSCKLTDWATVSLSVNNLLNRNYFVYYVSPGRSWFANVDLKF